MSSYRVVLSGHVLPNIDKSAAQARLAQLMNRELQLAGELLAGKSTTVKSHVDATTGEHYREALLGIGVDCRIEQEVAQTAEHRPTSRPDVSAAPTHAAVSAVPRNAQHGTAVPMDEPSAASKPAADYAIFLLALPIAASFLAWFWISGMNLLQSPGSKLDAIAVMTIVGTAIIAAMEAAKVGMVSDRTKGSYSPVAWFFLITLLWIVGYPAYLYKRRHYGLNNYLIGGIAIALVFTISYALLAFAINARVEEVQGHFQQFQRDLQQLRP